MQRVWLMSKGYSCCDPPNLFALRRRPLISYRQGPSSLLEKSPYWWVERGKLLQSRGACLSLLGALSVKEARGRSNCFLFRTSSVGCVCVWGGGSGFLFPDGRLRKKEKSSSGASFGEERNNDRRKQRGRERREREGSGQAAAPAGVRFEWTAEDGARLREHLGVFGVGELHFFLHPPPTPRLFLACCAQRIALSPLPPSSAPCQAWQRRAG